MLRLERRNAKARQDTAVEEVVRLALWRMDAAISPMLMKESARPYFEYASFNPAGILDPSKTSVDDALIPSPLLVQPTTNVLVYFNALVLPTNTATSSFSSPQVPEGELRGWAEKNFSIDPVIQYNDSQLIWLNSNLTVGDVQQALETTTVIEQVSEHVTENMPAANASAAPNTEVQAWLSQSARREGPVQRMMPRNNARQVDMQQQAGANAQPQQGGRGRNSQEYFSRYQQKQEQVRRVQDSKKDLYQHLGNADWSSNRGGKGKTTRVSKKASKTVPPALAAMTTKLSLSKNQAGVEETIMRPLWVSNLLILARDVRIGDQNYVQGAWLDWQAIRKELLIGIRDLLPEAELVPADLNTEKDVSRLMAALPVRLVPGTPAALLPLIASPLRLPLTIAWVCVVLAGAAVAVLLLGAVSLSERRGAFVSAVTHELRTPLTTFRIYSEMLSEGMVQDAEKQQRYLQTLTAEGSRLSHLVENVLSYARLERGRTRGQIERVTVGGLVARIQERLEQRAQQAEMVLVVGVDEATAGVVLETDMSGVEQVLFNLVDNACKYAGRAEDRRIHLNAMAVEGWVRLRVCDHGPGIVLSERRRLFQAFRKSAKHAAESAPGVGLGLALSRRLARQLGGDLRIDAHAEDGACFEFVLKVA